MEEVLIFIAVTSLVFTSFVFGMIFGWLKDEPFLSEHKWVMNFFEEEIAFTKGIIKTQEADISKWYTNHWFQLVDWEALKAYGEYRLGERVRQNPWGEIEEGPDYGDTETGESCEGRSETAEANGVCVVLHSACDPSFAVNPAGVYYPSYQRCCPVVCGDSAVRRIEEEQEERREQN